MNRPNFWLILWFVTVFVASAFLITSDTWFLLKARLQDMADTALEGRAVDLQHFLEAHKDLPPADLRAQIVEKYKIENSEDYVQITETSGSPVYLSGAFASHPLPLLPPEELDRRLYRNYRLGSQRFRLVSEQVDLPGRSLVVWLGRPVDQEIALLVAVRRSHIFYSVLLLLIAVAGGYWIARRSRLIVRPH